MDLDLIVIDEAEHRGYLKFDTHRTSVTYLCGKNHTENYTDPEEIVRAWVYSWLIVEKGYPAN